MGNPVNTMPMLDVRHRATLTCEMVHLAAENSSCVAGSKSQAQGRACGRRARRTDHFTSTKSRAAANASRAALHSPTRATVLPISLDRSGEKPWASQYLHTISKSAAAFCTLAKSSVRFEIAAPLRAADSTAALTDSNSATWVSRTRTILSRYASSKLRKDMVSPPAEPLREMSRTEPSSNTTRASECLPRYPCLPKAKAR
jgi:hypothetical protein